MNLRLALALLVMTVVSFGAVAADPPKPPNIVMIVSDDQAWADYGFMGHPTIRTPNLDRLAAQSAAFTNGYVTTPLCRPSLATMLTGLYPHQHKITGNDPPEGQKRPVMWDFIKQAPALPRLLQQKGYRSFQTGKWWEGHHSSGGFTDGMTVKGRHGDDGLVIGRKTLKPMYDFLEAGKGEPFFLWYAPMLPHTPHDPPARLLKKYQAVASGANAAKYYAMCEWLDETVGELLTYLDQKGLAENTIVVFLADNGYTTNPPGTAPSARGGERGKQSQYDGGLRTPILIRWPGRLKPERRADLVSSIDLAPTLLAAAGLPADPRMSGVNLLDVASGKQPARDVVFGELFVHTAVDVNDPAKNLTHRWVRKGDWKLIVPAGRGGAVELFNVARDPGEKEEVAGANAAKVAELRAELDAWWDGKSAAR
jgi:arylsulfatase A-like enzyme